MRPRGIEEKRNRQAELQIELEAGQDAVRKSERELITAENEKQRARRSVALPPNRSNNLPSSRRFWASGRRRFQPAMNSARRKPRTWMPSSKRLMPSCGQHEAEVATASFLPGAGRQGHARDQPHD